MTRSRTSWPHCHRTRPASPKGIPVALAEDGTTYRLQLVGNHVLIVGATGADKASVIWSIIAGHGRVGDPA